VNSEKAGKGLAYVVVGCFAALAVTATVAGCVAIWNVIL
jgi:hypothetical protein